MRSTFPQLLLAHAARRPDAPAMREKEYGIWQTYTWAQVAENVRAIACGLAQLGFKRGGLVAEQQGAHAMGAGGQQQVAQRARADAVAQWFSGRSWPSWTRPCLAIERAGVGVAGVQCSREHGRGLWQGGVQPLLAAGIDPGMRRQAGAGLEGAAQV